MFCDEALEALDAIAAGELAGDHRVIEHVATCPNCAAALESARTIERLLRDRPAPPAPAQFTARTMARLRRARWRSEQVLDVTFNLAMSVVVVAILTGIWTVVRRTGLSAISTDAVNMFGRGLVTMTNRVAPSLPLYAGATALLAVALWIWWWAERDLT